MAIGKITTPATWALGTVAPSTWFQNAQDTLNATQGFSIGNDTYLLNEEFDASTNSAGITADSISVGGKFVTSGMTNATVRFDQLAATDGMFGSLDMRPTSTTTVTEAILTSGKLGIGTRQFTIRTRFRIGQLLTRFDTIGNKGIWIGSDDPTAPLGILAGNDQATLRFRYPGGATTPFEATGITPSIGTMYYADIIFDGTNLSLYIYTALSTPTLVFGPVAFSGTIATFLPVIRFRTLNTIVNTADAVTMDFFKLRVTPRP